MGNVWAVLDENLRSVYKSQNVKAIKFVLEVFNSRKKKRKHLMDDDDDQKDDDNEEEECEKKLKCLSILNQNSEEMVKILKSDRSGFVDDMTLILKGIFKDYHAETKAIDDKEKSVEIDNKIDIDLVFGAFGFRFMDEYFFSLIKYGKSNKDIIKMISVLSKSCIVYQLVGCKNLMLILDKFRILQLLGTEDIFSDYNSNKSKQEMSASILLSIKTLKLIKVLTKGMNVYSNITRLQKECIEQLQGNGTEYIPRGFALNDLYKIISGVLMHCLSAKKSKYKRKSTYILFELCCNILTNIINQNEPIIFKILHVEYKRSKRIVDVLHKTYTDLIKNKKKSSLNKNNKDSS